MSQAKRDGDKDKKPSVCYECKKLGYFKINYLLLKKSFKKMKKKAMIVTWSDSEESSLDEKVQKMMNLCLMVQEEEVTSETQLDFIFDELQETFYDLMNLKSLI